MAGRRGTRKSACALAKRGSRRYHTGMGVKVSSDASSDAVVAITAHIPEDAMSAGLLGTERIGHGVRIRIDGLIVTVGYVVHEAENVWIGSGGTVVPGFVVGYDFDSGLALVKPTLPLGGPCMQLGRASALNVGDSVSVMSGGQRAQTIDARVVAKQEFAGRWEYVLDEAVFTAPPHESWSGAALVDSAGRLCGLGSLVIQGFEAAGVTSTVNMFVPIELLVPVIDEICEHGRRLSPPRPWLGVLVHDDQSDLTVVGVYRNCPADKAGVRPGDVIVGIDDEPVAGLANMFRRVWSLGSAGVEVPLNVLRNTEKMELLVHSGDRAGFQRKGTLQ
jgi:S1-C subfamily serine protease